MDINKNYDSKSADEKWYQHWMDKGYFYSKPDNRPAYTIVMPPPNVTGILHMGHALNNTVQDILIRRAKMQGYNTCWVPGTDHASIATEAKVVQMLKEKGIDKNKLSREEFLNYSWEWKEKYGGIILEQLKKLGCSLDWNRTAFTMDETYYASVIEVFVTLYEEGKIYRGVKMINWDPEALTALSDEEVFHKEVNSKLTYVQYKVDSDEDEYITIATVRPETILGDTAICVHPEDERYKHLEGKFCFVPLINRRIPIIFDDYIDMEFGTGALKVTPAHDINDYNLGIKHNLEVIDTLNEDGTLSEAAQLYIGEDRFAVRKKIIDDLKSSGNFVKQEDYTNQVGFSERTNAVIEPRLSMQWWCDMEEMAEPALKSVMEEQIEFFPPKFKNLYRHWMENIKDWCISRQLWWGQRIPAWYDQDGKIYVANSADEAFKKYKEVKPNGVEGDLRQDEDVLDTWFSSWLWPLEVFGWNENPDSEELKYYYPTQTLVTAPEIIFFWVARMIMAGHKFKNEKPFDQVYFTGIVRDKMGRKMSKSLGNSPDLLQLIDDYGADAVRFGVMISSPAGNDILFDESFLEQGKHFINKIWNAMKLVKMWEGKLAEESVTDELPFAVNWMQQRIEEARHEIEKMFGQFRLSEALKTIYSLIWDDFCSWYLEWVKPNKEEQISPQVYEATIKIFDELLQLLHPFMPFVTEEIYHLLKNRKGELMIAQLPEQFTTDKNILRHGDLLKKMISTIRDTKIKNQLKPRDTIKLFAQTDDPEFYHQTGAIIQRQVSADQLDIVSESKTDSINVVVQTERIFIQSEVKIDTSIQKGQLNSELEHLRGFLNSVEKKLNNERFMQNAKPMVIEMEQKKKADTLSKIQSIEESLASL